MRPIRVAQIGTSQTTHAYDIFSSMARQPDQFEIIGYADMGDHTFRPMPEVFDRYPKMTPEEILARKDLDAVVVETDENLLTHYATLAAERGFAVHMDKPGSEGDEDFDHLVDLVEQKNLVFHVAYMYRHNPAVLHALDMARSGRLGKIISVEAQMNIYHPVWLRQWEANFRGGVLFYLGCHLVDLVYMFKGEPYSVLPLSRCVDSDGVSGANDFGMALYQYPDGVSFAKVNSVEPGGFLRRQLVVTGTKGCIEIRPLENPLPDGSQDCDMRECLLMDGDRDETVFKKYEPFNRYDGMMAHFAAMVRGEEQNPFSYEYERALHKLIRRSCGF